MEILAEDCKKQGNECMNKEKYFEAVLHYTKGIKIDPHNPHIFSNRSAAFLKIQQYYHALDDAKAVIKMLPKWPKGYFRKGEVECAVEHYEDAVATYQRGLSLIPDDPTLVQGLRTAQEKLKEQRKAESRMPWYGVAFGATVGILIIVADEVLTKKALLKTDLIRSLVLSIIVSVCYGMALLYRYFVRSQRKSLTDAPIDFLDAKDVASLLNNPVKSSGSEASSSTSKPDKKEESPSNKSSARRRKH